MVNNQRLKTLSLLAVDQIVKMGQCDDYPINACIDQGELRTVVTVTERKIEIQITEIETWEIKALLQWNKINKHYGLNVNKSPLEEGMNTLILLDKMGVI
ncbi:hypothetical protein [Brevibacillus parabrevis]|uniref:hypothetical protein n=1 Tax=Brevibacillus parabrevis TaxID=54914 RepID=UPI00237FF751|nr:hypothetical protein [Brevibacillus parabrevis]WDV94881.1 hypothetical protein PSE45_25110 [Brevibacillus parabrevis]